MKRQGSSTAPRARVIATRPSSSGWRSASSASRENSPSSSRNRTPRCASVTSPGRGGELPPTSPAVEIVWCGARNGRWVGSAPFARRPQALAIRSTSIASARLRGGRMDGRRRAASDLPAPGGPTIRRLWPPAAAISSASRRYGWPRRSERSGPTGPAPFRLSSADGGGGSSSLPSCRNCSSRSSGITRGRCGKGRLRSVGRGHDDRRHVEPRRSLGHRQRPRHGSDRSVQGELTGQRDSLETLCRKLARRNQKAGRDRQVEARPGLAEVRRGQVGGDPVLREVEAGVLERGAHPLPRLAHGSVRQAHQREGLQAALADVHLHVDLPDLDAEQAESTRRGEHAGDATG